MKTCNYTACIFLFLSLYIYHDRHKQTYFQNLSSLTLQFFSHILVYFFKSCLSFTIKDIVAFSSNFLAYPVICGSLIHNGLIISLSLYSIKYLCEFLLPYGSFLETNILLTSISSVLYILLFL